MGRHCLAMGFALLLVLSCVATDAKKVVLRVASGSETSEIAIRKQIGEMYEKVNPNVDVKVVTIIGSRFDKQQTMIAAGESPDILYINQPFLAPWAEHGVLVDLGPYIKRDKFALSKLYPSAVRAVTYRNKVWAMPFEVSPLALLYNQDHVKRAGLPGLSTDWADKSWTWDDFVRALQSLTKDVNGDGKPDVWGVGSDWYWYWNWVWQAGGEVISDDGRKCLLDSPAAVAGMQFQSDLSYRYRVASPVGSDNNGMFVQGKVASYIFGRWLNALRSGIKSFEWNVAALPHKEQPANLLLTLHYGISRQCRNKDTAWDFLKFLVTHGPQAMNTASGMAMPVLREVGESDILLKSVPPKDEKVFADALEYSRPEPTHPAYTTWQSIVSNMFYPVFEGRRAAKEVAASVKRSVEAITQRVR